MHRKWRRVITIFGAVLLGGAVMLLDALLLVSPGRPQPFLDEKGNVIAGSIAEKVFIDVNGVRQGMFIKGKDATRPALLYVHGGKFRISSSSSAWRTNTCSTRTPRAETRRW